MSVSVSIVTPSFNQGRFLEETIRSVLCQRDQIHEYFVFDGGSTDGSADIIRKYAGGIDYWASEKDDGQSDAIHKGFSRATGDVLLWLNSDDVLLPGAVAKVRAAFDRHPEWDVLTGWHAWIDAETRILRLPRIGPESQLRVLWGIHHICQQTCYFKRSLYQKVGGLDLRLHCVMDTELWYRFFDAGVVWGHIPDFLAGFRTHDRTKGLTWLKKYAEEHAELDQKYPRYHARGLQHRAGQVIYRAGQLLSPIRWASVTQSRRLRGRKLVDVFGDWIVPTLEAVN